MSVFPQGWLVSYNTKTRIWLQHDNGEQIAILYFAVRFIDLRLIACKDGVFFFFFLLKWV